MIYIAVACVALMFVLPHVVHYQLESYLVKAGYKVCESESRQLRSRTIEFHKAGQACGSERMTPRKAVSLPGLTHSSRPLTRLCLKMGTMGTIKPLAMERHP